MLTTDEAADASAEAAAPRPPTVLRRAWDLPLWAHAAAAFVLLALLLPVVTLDAQYSADEGATLAQAQQLADGGDWVFAHPFPEVDPENDAFPLHRSDYGANGVVAYGKHPLYTLTLVAALRMGGVVGVLLLTILGTATAAFVCGLLAGRLRPGLERPTLWVTALVSPLFFDGFLVMAHSLAAAAAAGALLWVVTALPRATRFAWIGGLACVAATAMVRTEGAFFGVALALALAAAAVATRRLRPAALAAAVGATTIAAVAADVAWARAIVGPPVDPPPVVDGRSFSFLEGRARGFVHTWIRPSQIVDDGFGPVLLLVGAVALVVAAIVARRRPWEQSSVTALGGLGAALVATGALLSTPVGVPGLLPAFPVLFVGLALVGRRTVDGTEARLLLTVFALFALAVAAMQYAEGGSAEWGGRYFALGLPAIIPVAVLALARTSTVLDREHRRMAVAALAVSSLALTGAGLAALRSVHVRTDALIDGIVDVAAATGADPVVVTTVPAIPRLAWDHLDEGRWLLVGDRDRLPVYLRRLEAAGVSRLVLVGHRGDVETAAGEYRVTAEHEPVGGGWIVAELATDR